MGHATVAEAVWKKAAEFYEAQSWSGLVSGMYKGKLAAVYDRLAEAAGRNDRSKPPTADASRRSPGATATGAPGDETKWVGQ